MREVLNLLVYVLMDILMSITLSVAIIGMCILWKDQPVIAKDFGIMASSLILAKGLFTFRICKAF